jgi:TP901 family phage tail tape measure protein
VAERTVFIKVGAKVDGAIAGLRKVKAGVDDLTKADVKKPAKAFEDIANKSALMGGAVFLGIGKAISSFADFDQAMSAVSANSGATGDALNTLRDTAMRLGADTQFSATEAAQGINELAKAGVSTQDILSGGIKGALDLAAAGQIGVAQAAETTASALNQFQENGSQATHVADLLSNAANAAQGGVGDMGQALGQAGVAAHAAGLDIDETTTLLALFAKAGMTGSDAGTSLKTMMQRLAAPTDQAKAALQDLGVSAYDAQGNFVGAQALLGQLSDATKDMSTQARAAAFNVIFGTDAIRAASIAASAGADGYAEMNKEVTKVGGAADNAAKLTDNLKGDIERLGGALDTAFIQTGSAANGGLRTLVQGLEDAVDVVGRLPGPLVLAATGLAGIALTLPKGISLYRDFTGQLDTLGLSLDKISAKAPRAAKALRGLQAAGTLVALGSVSASIQETSAAAEVADVNVDKLAESLTGLTHSGPLQGGIADLFRHEGGLLNGREEFVSTADAIQRFNTTAYDALSDNNFAKLLRVMQPGAEDKFDKYVTQIDGALAQLVGSGHADQAKASIEALLSGIDDPQVREAAQKSFPQYDAALKNAGNSAEVAGGQMDGMSDDVATVQQKADDAKKALDNLKDTLEGFGSPLADQRAAQRDYKDAIDAAKQSLKDQRDELIKTRTEQVKARLGKVSTGPTQSSKDAVAKAQLRQQQAYDRLAAVQAKGSKATAKELQSAQQAVERANQSLSQAQGRMSSSGTEKDVELTAKQKKQIEAWADAQLKAGAALDLSTEAGRKNQAALDAIRDKALKAAAATFELTHSTDLAAKDVQKGRDDFIKFATQGLGMSATQAKALADNMGLVPKDVKTAISLSGVDTANSQLNNITGKVTVLDKTTAKPVVKPYVDKSTADATEARIDQLARQRSVFITISAGLTGAASSLISGVEGVAGSIFPKKKATGGPIYGPGTGTSDTAGIFALSNNEHVLTAREVAAAGGHGAIFALRKAILSGGIQFRAAGGPASVTAYRAAPAGSVRAAAPIDYDRLGAAVAAQMPPMLSVHSGADALAVTRQGISDWEWQQVNS